MGRFRLALTWDWGLLVRLDGKASMTGLDSFIVYLENCRDLLDTDQHIKALIDMGRLTKASLRVQLRLGHWVLQHRHMVDRVAVVGAGNWAGRAARAVFSLAGVHSVQFFPDQDEAQDWLDLAPFPEAW